MRIDPDPAGPELVMLSQYLDYQRETMLSKTDGLTRQQLARQHPPSQLTLAGLLYHLSLVEEDWMEVRFAGLPDREPWASVDWESDPDWEFRTAAQLDPEQLRSRYREACERNGYQARHSQIGWGIGVYVAPTDAQAVEEYEPHFWYYARNLLRNRDTFQSPPGHSSIQAVM